MRKAADDKQDGRLLLCWLLMQPTLCQPKLDCCVLFFAGMIALLQKMLQLYAAKALCQGSNSRSPVDEVISVGEEQWEQVIKQLLQSDAITKDAFLEDLQKRMESTVLGQSSGSYTQRVQVGNGTSSWLHQMSTFV